jgi:hypothetical protein
MESDLPADIASATILNFNDAPNSVDPNFSQFNPKFATFLVGVRADDFVAVGDWVFLWESMDGRITKSIVPVLGEDPPLPQSSSGGSFANAEALSDLLVEDRVDFAPISFAEFERNFGLQPADYVRAIQSELARSEPSAIPEPTGLGLVLTALLAAGLTRRPIVR